MSIIVMAQLALTGYYPVAGLETVLLIPNIRELTREEKDFVEGKWTKKEFEALQKLSFPKGEAYISLDEFQRKQRDIRRRLIGGLPSKVDADGTVDSSKLSDDEKRDICQLYWGLNPRTTKNFPPASLESSMTFKFRFEGMKIDVSVSQPRKPKKAEMLPSFDDLIQIPKNTKTTNGLGVGSMAYVEPPQGIQIVFSRNDLNRVEKATIISFATKAFMDFEVSEFNRMTEFFDNMLYGFNYENSQTDLNGSSVPKKALDLLAVRLRDQFPSRFGTIEEARTAARESQLLGSTKVVNLVLQLKNQAGGNDWQIINLARRTSKP
jgi:hypothetical protein